MPFKILTDKHQLLFINLYAHLRIITSSSSFCSSFDISGYLLSKKTSSKLIYMLAMDIYFCRLRFQYGFKDFPFSNYPSIFVIITFMITKHKIIKAFDQRLYFFPIKITYSLPLHIVKTN